VCTEAAYFFGQQTLLAKDSVQLVKNWTGWFSKPVRLNRLMK
jgi:hypothetical protein